MANGEAPAKKAAAAGTQRKNVVPRPGEALADIGRYIDTAKDAVAGVAFTEEGNKTRQSGEFFPEGTLPTPVDTEGVRAEEQVATRKARGNEIKQRGIGGFNAQMAVPGFNEMAGAQGQSDPIGSSTTTRNRPAWTPQQLQESAAAIDYEARAWGAQYDAKAAGAGLLSNAYQDLALDQQEQIMPIVQEAEKIFDDAQRQIVGIQEMADDVRANRINPGQFFANIGEAGVFAASMAVAAGHLAASLGGGPNAALSVVNGAIERNMRSQALNQAHDRAVLNSEIAIFDRMRALGVDRLNQANVYNGLMISMAQSQLEAIAAATASVELRAQIGIMQAQFAQKKQDLFMRAQGTIQSTTQMKLFAHSASARESARPKPLQLFQDVVKEQVSGEGWEQMTPEQQSQQVAARFREAQQKAQVSASPAELQAIMNTGGFAGMSSKMLLPIEEGQGVGIVDRKTGKQKTFVPTALFDSTFQTKEDRKKGIQGFRAEGALIQDWQDLYTLSESFISGSGMGGKLSQWVSHTEDSGFVIRGGKDTPEEVYMLTNLLNRIVTNTKRAQSGGHMEAVHGPGEYSMFMLQTHIPTDVGALGAALFGGDFTRQVAPGLELAFSQFEEGWAPMMSGVQVQ